MCGESPIFVQSVSIRLIYYRFSKSSSFKMAASSKALMQAYTMFPLVTAWCRWLAICASSKRDRQTCSRSTEDKLSATKKSENTQWIPNLGFWEAAHLPLTNSTLTFASHLGQNVGVRGGVGGQFPRNLNWSIEWAVKQTVRKAILSPGLFPADEVVIEESGKRSPLLKTRGNMLP